MRRFSQTVLLFFTCFILVSFTPNPLLPAQTSVEVKVPGQRELKFAARRLRVDPDKLKIARALLEEAVQLALRREEVDTRELRRLAQTLVRVNRKEASKYLERLYARLFSRAVGAPPETYRQTVAAAGSLFAAMGELDPERALQWIEQWPPPARGPSAVSPDLLKDHKRMLVTQLAQKNPQRALALLNQEQFSNTLGLRSMIAMQMFQRGEREQGLQQVKQAIDEFQGTPQLNFQQTNEFINLLGMHLYNYPEVLGQGAMVLAQRLQEADSLVPTQQVHLRIRGQQISLDPRESAVWSFVRRFPNRPELITSFLLHFPQLKVKIDAWGGLDEVLNPGRSPYVVPPATTRANTLNVVGSTIAVEGTVTSRGNQPAPYHLDSPTKLREAAAAGNLDAVIQAAQQLANSKEFELAAFALDLARQMLPTTEDLQRRVALQMSLIQAYQNLEGEADPSLIDEGFELLRLLEALEKEQKPSHSAIPGRQPDGSGGVVPGSIPAAQWTMYNAMLYGNLVRQSPETGVRRLRALPDDERKLSYLVQAAETLVQPIY